jgi:cell division protein FtsZ
MQPMSHDAYKHKTASDQWTEQAGSKSEIYEEQEDQWAILRHEVEEVDMQHCAEQQQPNWKQRDTDERSPSSLDSNEIAMPHQVDIVVVGVGGGGMNAINRMIQANVRGVRFVAMNTDAQVLALSQAKTSISLGQQQTKGLGAGGNAATGMRAATESTAEIRAALGSADLVFIAAGMGGGTGTGAAPIVASIAKKLGALTVGIVTLPFTFEGSRRRRIAEQGLSDLNAEIDALITVPNDRLLTTVSRERSLSDAFKVADDVLRQGVQGIAEVITVPGMINVDFADVRSVLREAGTALMSIGQGKGRNRALQAAEEAVAGGFLNVTIRGAKRVLFNISGGENMTLFEVNEVAERIGNAIDSTADIIFGAVIDPSLNDTMRVTLIAAGMEELHTARLEAIPRNTPATGPEPHLARTPWTPPTPRVQPVPSPPPMSPLRPINPDQAKGIQGGGSGTSTYGTGRQQRSLNDLRAIRSMGRRQEDAKDLKPPINDDQAIEPPSFLRRRDQSR